MLSMPSRRLVAGLLAAALSPLASAQQLAPPSVNVPHAQDTGAVANDSDFTRVVASFTVQDTQAEWMRLYFEDVELAGDPRTGSGAWVRLTAHADGAVQELNSRHLRQWQNSSAYFNGGAVQVELVSPPGIGASRLVMRSYDAGLPMVDDPSICGNLDDRTLSQDPRAARLMPVGCTSWLIDDCSNCLLTAGHCTGNISVVQFNVPLSNNSGSLNQPGPEDQYPIDAGSLQSNGGQGVGNDWAYFGVFENPTTGLTAAAAQGAVFQLGAGPGNPSGQTIRITGYGTDSSPPTSNQVQQTHTGPMVTSTSTTMQYATDTTGGNSGSPVIWEETGLAVGIHTHGGCTSGGGQNSGTAFSNSGLQGALADPQGICSAGGISGLDLPSILAPGEAPTLSVEVLGTPIAGVDCFYRTDGGSFGTFAMTHLGSGIYEVSLPAVECGDSPEYYFELEDSSCGTVLLPADAPSSVLSFLVGTATFVLADDFESDLGWSTNVSSGTSSGAWERGVPVNDPNWEYDPISDSDGSGSCYLTQNQLGNTDVDNGSVRLVSPTFDLSGGGLISYDYFLNLTGDDSLVVSASSTGSGPWTTVVTHSQDNGLAWTNHQITSAELAAAGLSLSSTMAVRFVATDGDPQSIVEAGIDAFQVYRLDCGSNNYCTTNGATMGSLGSTSIAANDLSLTCSSMPASEFGLFFYGDGQQAQPFGLGTLCVAGQFFRLGPPATSDASGTLTRPVDLTAPPSPAGLITAGSTWNFQCWFRSGASFDLSDGLSLSFQP